MLELSISVITLVSTFLLVYHHFLYPVLLKLVVKLNSVKTLSYSGKLYSNEQINDFPTITVVVPAYNEKKLITEKIFNLAALDYPMGKLDVIIACDGCTDNTVSLAREAVDEVEWSDTNFRVLDFKKNRGKIATINSVMYLVKSELCAFSDVSALISVDGLKVCAKTLKDKKVGAVTGCYNIFGELGASDSSDSAEAMYWDYQTKIKTAESLMGSTLGVHGAFYAIKTSLYENLPLDTINDDFVIPMNIVLQGFKVKYVREINSIELESSSLNTDWKRRLRISAGNAQQMVRLKSLLSPKYGLVAFNFISGKALRLMSPWLMIIAFFGALVLMPSHWMFTFLLIGQCCFYGLGLLYLRWSNNPLRKVGKPIAYLMVGHLANFIGCLNYIVEDQKGWKKI